MVITGSAPIGKNVLQWYVAPTPPAHVYVSPPAHVCSSFKISYKCLSFHLLVIGCKITCGLIGSVNSGPGVNL